MQNGTSQPVHSSEIESYRKHSKNITPQAAVCYVQCSSTASAEETLFRAYENPTYLQLKIPKYQQALPLTEEEILCTYKKKFRNKTWKQTVQVITFSACISCIGMFSVI